ncbi:MAG TPA: pitrilysin family protein [Steroidobacteraceae bacterium]|nr:pitrilysin family protein [Steroidobacteraceae bacterium]
MRALLLLSLVAGRAGAQGGAPADAPLRATLDNGLRVVVVRNALAPVATIELNVLAGADETPRGFPGMAHAQEHMAFRGCTGLSAEQTAALYAQLGGEDNADTQQTITQYFATVPASDLDVALEAQAACLRGVDDSQSEWEQERGAIEQEVGSDLSNPTYRFIDRLNADMFHGTPYAHDPLGTRRSFERTTGPMLEEFFRRWYAPGNAILVVVGDVDAQATLAKIGRIFGSIPDHPVPPHPTIELKPVRSESFTLESDLPFLLGFIAYRFPGTESPDYAAVEVLADVLGSQRGDLYGMVPAGQALAAEFALAESYPKASLGFAILALPSRAKAAPALHQMRLVIERYLREGFPEELVAAAKRAEVAAAEFQRNSIPGLASAWSKALAAEGRSSPEEDIAAIEQVTVDDVNRVARRYLSDHNAITATLLPSASGQPVASQGFGGAEKLTAAPTHPVELPAWAAQSLARLEPPHQYLPVTDMRLDNGLRLIVRTDRTSPTVSLIGEVKHDFTLQTPRGKEGTADLLIRLFSYGTTHLDRLAFQKALDDIAATESAGFSFSVAVLKANFSRAVELLADNELHPALPSQAFDIVKPQTVDFVIGNLKSPKYRTLRALDEALLPQNDPVLREVTPATLAHVELEDLRELHARAMRPDLTTLVVIGDVSAAEARSVIERWFGDWRAQGAPPETTLPPVPPNRPSAVVIADAQAVQDSVILAEQLELNRFDPDYYPLQLGNHVLGGGFYATRLYHDLRQVAGYVYTVDVSLDAGQTRTSYAVSYGCDPRNVSKARALIERDLEQMRTQDVSEEELRQAKALLLRRIPLSEASEQAVARGLLARAEIGLPLDEPVRASREYSALSAAQVRAAFARHVRPRDLVQVVRGPPPH